MQNNLEKIISNNKKIKIILKDHDDIDDVIYFDNKRHVFKDKKLIPLNEYLRFQSNQIKRKVSALDQNDNLMGRSKLGKNTYKVAVRVGTGYITSIIVDKYGVKSSGNTITDSSLLFHEFSDLSFPELPEHMFSTRRIRESVEVSKLTSLLSNYELKPFMVRGQLHLASQIMKKTNAEEDPSLLFMSGCIDEFELVAELAKPSIPARELIDELELLQVDF